VRPITNCQSPVDKNHPPTSRKTAGAVLRAACRAKSCRFAGQYPVVPGKLHHLSDNVQIQADGRDLDPTIIRQKPGEEEHFGFAEGLWQDPDK